MNAYVKALAYMVIAGAASFIGMELARHAQQRYSTDLEIRLRGLVAEAMQLRALDRQVKRETPHLLWAVYEMLEDAATDQEAGTDGV